MGEKNEKKINEGNGISTIPFYNQHSGKTKKKKKKERGGRGGGGEGGGGGRQTDRDRQTDSHRD